MLTRQTIFLMLTRGPSVEIPANQPGRRRIGRSGRLAGQERVFPRHYSGLTPRDNGMRRIDEAGAGMRQTGGWGFYISVLLYATESTHTGRK